MKNFVTAFSILFVATVTGFGIFGCRESKRTYITNAAPTVSYTLIVVDVPKDKVKPKVDKDYIACVKLKGKFKHAPRIWVMKNKIKTHVAAHSILVWAGQFNDCPDLFRALCTLKDKQDFFDEEDDD